MQCDCQYQVDVRANASVLVGQFPRALQHELGDATVLGPSARRLHAEDASPELRDDARAARRRREPRRIETKAEVILLREHRPALREGFEELTRDFVGHEAVREHERRVLWTFVE